MNGSLIVFIVCLCLLGYTFAGYPLVLLVWSRWRPRPVACASFEPPVTIVICVFNGAASIAGKLASCLEQDYPKALLRVIVASDGSTDSTEEIVRQIGDRRVELIAFPERRGKATCLNEVIGSCTEEFLVLSDARQRLDRGAVRALLRNFADPAVGGVSGQLVFTVDGITPYGESLDAYWRYEKSLRRAESAIHSSVGVTGALYALRRAAFAAIPADTILDDLLIPMQVVLGGRRVLFEDAALAFDVPSQSATIERARKTRTLAGNFQLLTAHPQLLLPWRNPILLQFLSHKVARLLAPAALAGALISNLLLALNGSALFGLFLAVQLVAYACAACGLLWPAANRFLPAKLSAGFVSLNWFVVLGLFQFLGNRHAHLWQTGPSVQPEAHDPAGDPR